jgi:hypothetical protein
VAESKLKTKKYCLIIVRVIIWIEEESSKKFNRFGKMAVSCIESAAVYIFSYASPREKF